MKEVGYGKACQRGRDGSGVCEIPDGETGCALRAAAGKERDDGKNL